ncbi:MAG: flavodoxin family protein [Lachnospiraceae bacterium]|nr:flavodoxin family protein [Lachnospiraceae bacterium]
MKTVIINGSPRKNQNTANILKEAQRGAEAAGHETVYYNLYDLKFTGCKSCLGCKRKGNTEPYKCIIKDELSEVLDAIYEADHLIIGSPIYFGQPTGELRSFMERACFPPLSYNDYSSLFNRKVDVTVFLTMNNSLERYNEFDKSDMEKYFGPFRMLKGDVKIIPVCDTLQVNDYSKYEMASFSEEHKKEVHEHDFPKDLEVAFNVGSYV